MTGKKRLDIAATPADRPRDPDGFGELAVSYPVQDCMAVDADHLGDFTGIEHRPQSGFGQGISGARHGGSFCIRKQKNRRGPRPSRPVKGLRIARVRGGFIGTSRGLLDYIPIIVAKARDPKPKTDGTAEG